jgi:hypothetical protein
MGVLRDITRDVMMHAAQSGQPPARTIDRFARDLSLKLDKTPDITKAYPTLRPQPQGDGLPYMRRIYLPRAITQTIMALSRGWTVLF